MEKLPFEDSGQVYRDNLAEKLREIKNDANNQGPEEARQKMGRVLEEEKGKGIYYGTEHYSKARTKHLAKIEARRMYKASEEEKRKEYEYHIKEAFQGERDKEKIDALLSAMDALIKTGMIRDDFISMGKGSSQFEGLPLLDPKLYKIDEIKDKYRQLRDEYGAARNSLVKRYSNADKNYFSSDEAADKKYLIGQDLLGISKIHGGYSERHPEYLKEREENFKKFIELFKRTPEEIEQLERDRKEALKKDETENRPFIERFKERHLSKADGHAEVVDKQVFVRETYAAWADLLEDISDLYEKYKDFVDPHWYKFGFFNLLSEFDATHKYAYTKKLLEASLNRREKPENFWSVLAMLGMYPDETIGNNWAEVIGGGEQTARELIFDRPDIVFLAPNSATLPAVIAREAIKDTQIKEIYKIPEGYKPYFTYTKTKTVREYIEAFGSHASLAYMDKIEGEGTKIVERIRREIAELADTIESELKRNEKRPLRLEVFDESYLTGSTRRIMMEMAERAVKLLLEKGVLKSSDEVAVFGSSTPFGGYKPQIPKIVLAGKDGFATYKQNQEMNKIMFEFGEIIGRNVAKRLKIDYRSRLRSNKKLDSMDVE